MTTTPEEIRSALAALVEPTETQPVIENGEVTDECRIVRCLIESFLLWESSITKSQRAMESVRTELVDLNEMRVCLTTELVGILGVRYPLARERSERIRTCLNVIFDQEDRMDLGSLVPLSKRDARSRLDAMPGMVPFVSARVVLLELGGHAFPVDSRVRGVLKGIGYSSESESALATKLERVFRAGEVIPIHAALERTIDQPATAKTKSRTK